MITDSELEKLADFRLEKDGTYCDRWEFTISPNNKERTDWRIGFHCEIDASVYHIKNLKDMEDLKNVYHAISNSELVFFKYFSTDGRGFVEEKEYLYYQSILDGKIRECETCYGGKQYISTELVEEGTEIIRKMLSGKHVWIKCVDCDGVGHFEIK